MNEFIQKMLNLGGCLCDAQSNNEKESIVKDAEELYRKHIEQLNKPCVMQQSEQLVNFLWEQYKVNRLITKKAYMQMGANARKLTKPESDGTNGIRT